MAELKINHEYIVKITAEVETDLTDEEIKDLISTLPEVLADVITDEITDGIGTVDVEPVKRGKWEVVRTHNNFIKHMYKCPTCEKNQFARSNYCPNCGAKMDGKEVQE